MNKLLAAFVLVCLLLAGAVGYIVASHTVGSGGRGGTSNADAIQLDSSLTVGTFLQWGVGVLNGVAGSAGQATGITIVAKTGTCSTASSTLFAVQNPYAATSTLTYAEIEGLQGATSTDILVGTSTTAAPAGLAVATSSVGRNIFGIYNLTNGKTFYSVSGVTMGAGLGYTQPSAGTYPTSQGRVVVGPLEYVLGFSTSTAGGNTNGGLTAGTLALPASCTYKLNFER